MPIILQLLRRLALVMGVFSLQRLCFFAFNHSYFPTMHVGKFLLLAADGLRYDLTAILYANTLLVALVLIPHPFRYRLTFQKGLKWLFLSTNTIIIGANLVDFVYFRYTLRRTTASFTREFQNEAGNWDLVAKIALDFWYLGLIFAVFVYILYRFSGKPIKKPKQTLPRLKRLGVGLAILVLGSGLFVLGIRGRWAQGSRPIAVGDAVQFAETPIEMAIVLNTPFAVFKTLDLKTVEHPHYFATEAEAEAVYSPIHVLKPKEPFRPLNVVVLILESFGREYIGFYNKGKKDYAGYTPFLDSLLAESRTFSYSFANGKRSMEAMPAALSSVPSFEEPFVISPYIDNKQNSLASLLKTKGYQSAYFHGANNGSMLFNAYAGIAGFDRYFGRNEYANDADFDGAWGIWDEEFLQYYAREMNKMKQPFVTSLFTLTSHHPFRIPERYAGKFPKGRLKIHQCIGYTDYALRRFFETAAKMPYYQNTLFVITADHTSESFYPEYQTSAGAFAAPLAFFRPNGELKGQTDRIAQQDDIMPTVLNYLNFDGNYLAFGIDALDPQTEGFAVNYNGVYQWFEGDFLLQFDKQKAVGLYRFKNDVLLKENLLGKEPETQARMTLKIKAFLQQYNRRLLDDDMLPKP